jgi:hypothetical protein
VLFRAGPYTHGQSAAYAQVTDRTTIAITSFAVSLVIATPRAGSTVDAEGHDGPGV